MIGKEACQYKIELSDNIKCITQPKCTKNILSFSLSPAKDNDLPSSFSVKELSFKSSAHQNC